MPNFTLPQVEDKFIPDLFQAASLGDQNALLVVDRVSPGALVAKQAQNAMKAMQSLRKQRCNICLPAIERELRTQGVIKSMDDWLYFQDYLAQGEAYGDYHGMADELVTMAQRRAILSVFSKAALDLEDLRMSPAEISHKVSQALCNITTRSSRKALNLLDFVDPRINDNLPFVDLPPSSEAIKVGLFDDNITIHPGYYMVVAGRPGSGKSALGVQSAVQTATHGVKTLFISLELSEGDIAARIMSRITGIPSWRFKRSKDITQLSAENRLTSRNISFWCPDSMTPWDDIESTIRAAHADGVQHVIIDYFGLIGRKGLASPQDKEYTVAAILSGRIRSLTKDLGLSTLLLAQLNREITKDAPPAMENLRESGQIEQDAQVIIALYKQSDQLCATLLKNRDGSAGHYAKIAFDGTTNTLIQHEPESKADSNSTSKWRKDS